MANERRLGLACVGLVGEGEANLPALRQFLGKSVGCVMHAGRSLLLVACGTTWASIAHFAEAFHPISVRSLGTGRMSEGHAALSASSIISASEVRSEGVGWFQELAARPGVQVLDVKEWRDESWRAEGGFQGRDFCHSASASVRVLDYVMLPATSTPTPTTATATPTTPTPTATTTDVGFGTALEAALYPQLVGPAHFTARAESHQGLCHGGSFCALMDDAIGWMGFCVSGTVRPWSGYTVQINTSLKKSVAVGSVLRLESWVRRREGARKFWIDSRLVDAVSGTVHCEAQGLFLLSKEQPFD